MNYWKPEEEPLKKGQEVTMFSSHLRPEIMLSLHNGLNTILIVGKGGEGRRFTQMSLASVVGKSLL